MDLVILRSVICIFAAIILRLLWITPRGIVGCIIKKQIEKGNLQEGKYYFPQYFTADEAVGYHHDVGFWTLCITSLALTSVLEIIAKSLVVPIISIPLIPISGYQLRKTIKDAKNELKEKNGSAKSRHIFRLYKAIGASETVGFIYPAAFSIMIMVIVAIPAMFLAFLRSFDEKDIEHYRNMELMDEHMKWKKEQERREDQERQEGRIF